ncbi:MAG: nitroreductase family protein [Candidatus Jordarchaeum sp.]|uniref:nitroreductase family protein n=1 Tax=Candidatus Jordarchaeum sp. TaxID=2823881 RepID=UPI00404B10BA
MTEAIETRQSIRKFKSDDVSDEIIFQLLDMARKAPSAENAQPWEFIIIKDQKIKGEIIETLKAGIGDKELNKFVKDFLAPMVSEAVGFQVPVQALIKGAGYYPLLNAPVLIAVCMKDPTALFKSFKENYSKYRDIIFIWFVLSIGAAVENLILTAVPKGLATCWTSGFMFGEERVKKILEIPEGVRLLSIIALGYPEKNPFKTPRKPLEEIVYLDKYSKAHPALTSKSPSL